MLVVIVNLILWINVVKCVFYFIIIVINKSKEYLVFWFVDIYLVFFLVYD